MKDPEPIKYTEKLVQRTLMSERYRRNFVIPNYTPSGWWECDVMELTKAGYMAEYEVKLTVSDFKQDAHKGPDHRKRHWAKMRGEDVDPQLMKHGCLNLRQCVPNRFFYVTSPGLLTLDQIPEWAGLLEVRLYRWGKRIRGVEKVLKKAPRLHTQRVDPKVEQHARSVCYYRMHNLLQKR